jgi:Na+-transporting methylmalonyl-CoA/oxaloacetate decarboxylase gamma subunit
MLVGMGTVFVFLSILVMAMSLMAFIVHRLMPTSAGAGVSEEEVAAMTAAIMQHRKTQQ